MQKGWSNERQAFVQHYGSDVLDASVLLMPLTLFIAPKDPRWLSTLDAIGDELVSDSLVYRYNVEASPDGLRGDEGTFSICSFWYVEALTRAGRLDEARLAFEKMLTYANHLGLYSEEIGPDGRGARQLPAGVHPPRADQRGLQPGPHAGLTAGEGPEVAWIDAHVERTGPVEITRERPWATVPAGADRGGHGVDEGLRLGHRVRGAAL